MSGYKLTWITENVAFGCAPMSYEDLDVIKGQGVDAVINLCAEYCDLHEIEAKTGFEVYYLPVDDECAPEIDQLEKALTWLDNAIAQGKKILVHCRFGMGRTGTFLTAYLIRKGDGLKSASKKLKHTCAGPSSYSQLKFLKEYAKRGRGEFVEAKKPKI
jgi:protein-tyrosine phosphatase